MPLQRVIVIVLDACGVGELPDAALYGDSGAATLPHVAQSVGGLAMPHCRRLGLGNIIPLEGVPPSASPSANFGKMAEKAPGKDSTTGHWELGGVIVERPFPAFPNGFPSHIVAEFESRTGVKTIGNYAASGTEIIKQLGEEHLRTGSLILYTSADSVFQLAAHESLYPLSPLYDICQIARELLHGEYAVARVIARPFVGTPGNFIRTPGRKDFSLLPPSDTVLDIARNHGLATMAIGKISDLYGGRGISTALKTVDNDDVMNQVIRLAQTDHDHRLIFANCVDFDMLWGHRNDEFGFARGLEAFDRLLGTLMTSLRSDDILCLTADHGCDPTIKSSTDHTREYVPILAYGQTLKQGVNLGTRATFADLAATICEALTLPHNLPGTSFFGAIRA